MNVLDLITTALEVVGLVALAVAGALFVAGFSLPAGIATGGVLLITVSALLSFLAARRRKAATR